MLADGLFTFLSVSSLVQAQLGTPNTRVDLSVGIFPGLIPIASDLPSLVLLQISGDEAQTFDGRGELRSARFQFSSYGYAYGDAKLTAKAVKDTLIAYQGVLAEGTEIDSVYLISEVDTFVKAPATTQESGGRSLYHTAVDLEFWYREAA